MNWRGRLNPLALALLGWSAVVPAIAAASFFSEAGSVHDRLEFGTAEIARAPFEAVTERPLFSPSRRPEPQSVAPPPAPLITRDRQIAVKGIYIDGRIAKAFVTTAARADGFWIAPKSEVGGWTVEDISGGEVTFKAGDETFAVMIHPARSSP